MPSRIWVWGWSYFLVFWLLTKYATWSGKSCPLVFIGTAPLYLGGIFNVDFTSVILYRSSLFLIMLGKNLLFVWKDIYLSPSNKIMNILVGQYQKKLFLVVYSISQNCVRIRNHLSKGEGLLFLRKKWVIHLLFGDLLLEAEYWSHSGTLSCCTHFNTSVK